MKKLLVMGAFVLLTTASFSQDKPNRSRHQEMTPEQQAELQTKKMTLDLELTDKQQQQILELNKKKALERKSQMEKRKALREKGEKPSGDEVFQKRKERLDKQIAHQQELKKILNEKQYETWKKSRKHNAHKIKTKTGKNKLYRRGTARMKRS